MSRLLPLLLLLLSTPAIAGAQPPAAGAEAGGLFDSRTLHEVRLFIHSQDLRELRERYAENVYFPADFLWRGIRVRNVGIRVRGLATRSAVKPALSIDFDRYVSGQRFLGLRGLVLDNLLKDPAFVRERTSMAFIERMGQPAPRESFARVYINGVYGGLYTIVEAVNADYLERLGQGHAYLFEHKFAGGFHGEYLGDDYEPYKHRLEARTHETEADAVLYGPIRELFHEVNQEVDGAWRERVSRLIDLPQLVTHVAIEMFLSEYDGFLGGAGMANFYLYRPEEGGAHRLLAWDRDTTFQEIGADIFSRADENELFRRALTFDDLRALYLDVMARCARAALEDGWLEREILGADALIRDAVYEDAGRLHSTEDYDLSIAHLLSFARLRPLFVLDAISRLR